MKAIQASLNLFEKNTDLEKGPRVAFLEVVAELRDPGLLIVLCFLYYWLRHEHLYTGRILVLAYVYYNKCFPYSIIIITY